ncbi:UNVERIFIED_CONTAM: hypothetical protein Sindi_1029300 [Sesamum indicum]
MANPNFLGLFFTTLFFTLIVFQLGSTEFRTPPLHDATLYRARLSRVVFSGGKNYSNSSSSSIGTADEKMKNEFRHGNRKLGAAYAPLPMSMLPKGPIPPSGPSKRINNYNN